MQTWIVILILGCSLFLLVRRFVRQIRSGAGGCCGTSCPGCPSGGKPGHCSGNSGMSSWNIDSERKDA